MDELNGRPQKHPAKRWIERANSFLDEQHQITMWGIAQRCGRQYSYVNAILNGHFPATEYVEDRLQSIITRCKEIIREGEDAEAQG